MANSPDTYLSTAVNREELAEEVGILFPKDAQVYNAVRHTGTKNDIVQWTKDVLATPAQNAEAEGDAFTADTLVIPSRDSNYTQINKGEILVSRTQQQVASVGASDLYQYEKEKKMKEVLRDVEYSFLQGTQSAGTSALPTRGMKGILSYVSTNVNTGTSTATHAFTRAILDDVLLQIWNQGGDPDILFVGGFNVGVAASFTAANGDFRRTMDASNKTLVNQVSVYDGPYGSIAVRAHRQMPTDTALVVDTKLLEIAELQPLYHEMLPKDGDRVRGHIVWEGTIKVKQELGLGKATGLTTS